MTRIITAALCALGLCLAAFLAQPAAGQGTLLTNDMILYQYVPPRSEIYRPIYEKLKKRKILEELAEFLSPLKLDSQLMLSLEEGGPSCKHPNSYYDGKGEVHLCYSWFYMLEHRASVPYPRKPGEPFTVMTPGLMPGVTRADVLIGGTISVILHELGHAIFDLDNIPRFGREEDAADQFAGILLLQFGDKVAMTTIKGTYNVWHSFNAEDLLDVRRLESDPKLTPSQKAERLARLHAAYQADVHSLGIQRAYNFLCLAYGKDKRLFKQMADKLLPPARIDNCTAEYDQAADAFRKTIIPKLDTKKMALVRKMQILRPEDFKF